jgi:hypothetical protein
MFEGRNIDGYEINPLRLSLDQRRSSAGTVLRLTRKHRDDVDHLQVEAALLPVARKRHIEERAVEPGSRCRGPDDGDDALQQAHDGQGAVFGDAPLQVLRGSEVGGPTFLRRQLINRLQDKIVEKPSIGSEAVEEGAVADKDFLDRTSEVMAQVAVAEIEEGAADGS